MLKFSSIWGTILWILSLGKYQLLLVYPGWPGGTVTSLGSMFQAEFLGEQSVALHFRVCGLIKNSCWKFPYKTSVPFRPLLLICHSLLLLLFSTLPFLYPLPIIDDSIEIYLLTRPFPTQSYSLWVFSNIDINDLYSKTWIALCLVSQTISPTYFSLLFSTMTYI